MILSRRLDHVAGAHSTIQFPGDHSEGVTPVPIPNTAVKSLSADGTAWETAWESRTLPGLLFGEAHHNWWAFLLGVYRAG